MSKVVNAPPGMVLEDHEDETYLISYNGSGGRVVVPAGIKGVITGAFAGRGDISEVHLPKSCDFIGPRAFAGCAALERVRLLSDNMVVGEEAFAQCVSLKEVDGNDHVSYYDRYAFLGCRSLESVDFEFVKYVHGVPAGMFAGCTSLRSVDADAQVLVVQDYAFAGCSSLERVRLGKEVHIQQGAFAGCSSLRDLDVSWLGAVPPLGAFAGCPALGACHIAGEDLGALPDYRPHTMLDREPGPEAMARALIWPSVAGWTQRVNMWAWSHPADAAAIVDKLCEVLATAPDIGQNHWARAVAFVCGHATILEPEVLARFEKCCVEGGCAFLQDMRMDHRVRGRLPGTQEPEPTGDPALDVALANWEFSQHLPHLRQIVRRGVKYAKGNGTGTCDAEALLFLMADALFPLPDEDFAWPDSEGIAWFQELRRLPRPSSEAARKIAGMLKLSDLRREVSSCVSSSLALGMYALPAWGLYEEPPRVRRAGRDPNGMTARIQAFSQIDAGLPPYREDPFVKMARTCRWCATANERHTGYDPETFQETRFATPEEAREWVLGRMGLDSTGSRDVVINGRKYTLRLAQDGEMGVYNEAGRRLKRLPSASSGTDPKEREMAVRILADCRKQLKDYQEDLELGLKVICSRQVPVRVDAWRIYFNANPAYRKLMQGVVWGQNGVTFIAGANGPEDAEGNPVTLTGDPVYVPCPSELDAPVLEAWRKSFQDGRHVDHMHLYESCLEQPFHYGVSHRYQGIRSTFLNTKLGNEIRACLRKTNHGRVGILDLDGASLMVREIPVTGAQPPMYELGSFFASGDPDHVRYAQYHVDWGCVWELIWEDSQDLRRFLDSCGQEDMDRFIELGQKENKHNALAALMEHQKKDADTAGPLDDLSL